MFKKIVIGLLAIIAILLIVVAVQPADYKVERSATFNVPPSVVFEQFNELRNWEKWSEWHKLDPKMKLTYSTPSSGPGAWYQWDGDDNAGSGKMTILETKPNELIKTRLEFFKPWQGEGFGEFTFVPGKDPGKEQTTVTWTMTGKYDFKGKALNLCFKMNDYIGKKHEDSMINIRKIVEPDPTGPAPKGDPKGALTPDPKTSPELKDAEKK